MKFHFFSILIVTIIAISCNDSQNTTEVETVDSSTTPQSPTSTRKDKDGGKADDEFIPVESDGAILAGVRVDAIKRNSSEQSLIRDYGKENVVDRRLDEGEGNMVNATILFPGNKNEVEIFWKDPVTKQDPRLIIIKGKGTMWNIDQKIKIGTQLPTLESLNKKFLFITGCCFDAPFTIVNWNNGSLAKLMDPGIVIRLKPTSNTTELNKKIIGDKSYSTTDSLIQKSKMEVSTILVRFD